MKLTLTRTFTADDCEIGYLSVAGQTLCYTLEDRFREVPGRPVTDWKVPGATAIPCGVYRVVCDYSERFHRVLPRLLNVPGFTGIRIHAGNSARDTEGCILLGLEWPGGGQILRSQDALTKLFKLILTEPEVIIEVSGPVAQLE